MAGSPAESPIAQHCPVEGAAVVVVPEVVVVAPPVVVVAGAYKIYRLLLSNKDYSKIYMMYFKSFRCYLFGPYTINEIL